MSHGANIFQRPFLRGLFLEGLIFGGAYLWREICVSKIDCASLIVERKFTFFALHYFVFEGNCQVQAPPPGGGLYLEGCVNGEFFCVTSLGGFVGGGYTRRGLFSEFYGIFANAMLRWKKKMKVDFLLLKSRQCNQRCLAVWVSTRTYYLIPSVVFSPGTSARGCWARGCLSRGFFPSWEDRWKRFKIKITEFFFKSVCYPWENVTEYRKRHHPNWDPGAKRC